MTWKNIQLPLSSDEVLHILGNSSEGTVLVGGQALALWSQIYRVRPPNELSGGISADVDFIGSVSAAKIVGRALNRAGGSWKLHEVDPGDATPQTAKLSLTVEGEGHKEIDFLGAIVGVKTDQLKTRAVELRLPGLTGSLRIIHPLDLLASRLHNLADIPDKRDAQGVAQARLAISVVRAFISQAHDTLPEHDVFPFVEEVRRIALKKKLGRVFHEYGFDVLSAVPVELFKSEAFLAKRWPQVQALVSDQRETQARMYGKYPPWPGGIRA